MSKVFSTLFAMVLTAVATLSAQPQKGWIARYSYNTSGIFEKDGKEIIKFGCNFFLEGWQGGSMHRVDVKAINQGKLIGKSAPNAKQFTAELDVKQLDERTLYLAYKLTAREDVRVNTVYANYTFPAPHVVGQAYTVENEEPKPFPKTPGDNKHLFKKKIKKLVMGTTHGPFTFEFDNPTGVHLQDSREWGDVFSLRLGHGQDDTVDWKAGTANVFAFKLTFPAPIAEFILPKTVVMKAGKDWIPLKAVLNIKKDSALDFTRFNFTDAPAGKYGYAIVKGKDFVFEKQPDKPVKLYGINFVGTGQYNSHERAAELAERLHRLGYNTVRFHHHDNGSVKRTQTSTTELHPENMDKLDFFFNELKKRGIYSTIDLYVSRRLRACEIWPDATGEMESIHDFKRLIPVNRRAMENWKTYTRNFMTHRNPYTGLTYAEDPALSWISLVNENTPSLWFANLPGRVGEEWLKAWKKWLAKRYPSTEARNKAWNADRPAELTKMFMVKSPTPQEEKDFSIFVEEMYTNAFREMKALLRDELKCKALLTDMNFSTINPWTQTIRKEYDYVDHHFYVDHPSFLDQKWKLPSRCPNLSVIQHGNLGGTFSSFSRMFDRPFTISEYNYSGPGRYRGVGGILTGCIGAIQDWAAIWRFAYAHGNGAIFKVGPTNYFDMCRDPLNQCAERAILMLYLRQDMKPVQHSIAITMPEDYTYAHTGKLEQNLVPNWKDLLCFAQVGTVVGKDNLGTFKPTVSVPMNDKAPVTGHVIRHAEPLSEEAGKEIMKYIADSNWLPKDTLTDFSQKPIVRQTGDKQFTVIPQKNMMLLNTPKTAGGFAPANETIKTDALSIDILDTDATVWASSLDNQPLVQSKHILVTHLTDLVNTNMKFAERERQTLLHWGQVPHLVRNGRANIAFKHNGAQKITVWNLRTDGERLAQVPVTKTADGFNLNLAVEGPDGAQMLYEIVIE